MNEPVSLIFPRSAEADSNVRLQLIVDYPLLTTEGEINKYAFTYGTLAKLRYHDYHFYMCFYDLDLTASLTSRFSIDEASFFLCFALSEGLTFRNKSGKTIHKVTSGSCYAAVSDKGELQCFLEKGKRRFFYISVKRDWLAWHSASFPCFIELFNSMTIGKNSYRYLPVIKINFGINRILSKLYAIKRDAQERDTEATVLTLVKELMARYQGLIESRSQLPIYKVKRFIEENFVDKSQVKIRALSDKFHMVPRTLERNYLKEFGITIGSHVKDLLMRRAQLLLSTGKSVKLTSDTIGYEDVSSFTRAFSVYYGYPPTKMKTL